MIVNRLEIENFQGIAHARLELTPLTVLVGLNGSGKTTVLEALYLAGGHRSGPVELTDRDPAGQPPLLRILQRRGYWEKELRLPDAELRLGSEEDPDSQIRHHAELHLRGPRWLIRPGAGRARIRISSPPALQPLEEWDRSRQAVLLDPCVGPGLEESLWFPQDPVDPTIRREPPMLLEGRDERVARQLREIYDLPIRRFSGGAGGGEQPHTVWAVLDGQPVPVEQLGDGIRAAFRALCLMAVMEAGLFLWDGPESHQHPDALQRLMRTLVEALRERPALQAVVATQSREVLEVLREIASGEEEREWAQKSLSVLFLILDVRDQRLYAERFTGEEFSAFEEAGNDIRRFWLRRGIPQPPGIPR